MDLYLEYVCGEGPHAVDPRGLLGLLYLSVLVDDPVLPGVHTVGELQAVVGICWGLLNLNK